MHHFSFCSFIGFWRASVYHQLVYSWEAFCFLLCVGRDQLYCLLFGPQGAVRVFFGVLPASYLLPVGSLFMPLGLGLLFVPCFVSRVLLVLARRLLILCAQYGLFVQRGLLVSFRYMVFRHLMWVLLVYALRHQTGLFTQLTFRGLLVLFVFKGLLVSFRELFVLFLVCHSFCC
jgi:hypothetical protein